MTAPAAPRRAAPRATTPTPVGFSVSRQDGCSLSRHTAVCVLAAGTDVVEGARRARDSDIE